MAITNKQALASLTAWIVEAMEYLPLDEETKSGLDILLDLQKQPEQDTLTAPKLNPSTTCIECFRRLCQCGACHHCEEEEDTREEDTFTSVRTRILSDVALVANGTMSKEQCISYAFQGLDIADVTHEQAMQIMDDLNAAIDALKPCHLCQTLTSTACVCCHKPTCDNCGTIELTDMTTQAEGLMCNQCWKDYGQALSKKPALDISLYAAIPPRNYAEAERYEEVSRLVYHAVEALEEENQPLTIKAIHEMLGQPALIKEVREIVREQYSGIEE